MNEVLYRGGIYQVGQVVYRLVEVTERFVIVHDGTAEGVMNREAFEGEAQHQREWGSNRFIYGETNSVGHLTAHSIVNGDVSEWGVHGGRWCIDLSLVPREAYVWGYDR